MTARTDLAVHVEEYLALRRRLGFALRSQGQLLESFVRFAERSGHRGPMTRDLAMSFARAGRAQDLINQRHRLGVVRRFALHRWTLDPATQIPPAGLLGRSPHRPTPHVYTDDETAALLRAAAAMRGALRARTYATYFGLLACTGLRPGEAVRLTLADVDLDGGVLTVRSGKSRRSRLVPLHSTALAALCRYDRHRGRTGPRNPAAAFFQPERGRPLTLAAVHHAFARLRTRLGWATPQGRPTVRLHQFRHAFATRRLLRWYAESADVPRKIHALATYLGHADIASTYWYLSAVPEILAITARRFEEFAAQGRGRPS